MLAEQCDRHHTQLEKTILGFSLGLASPGHITPGILAQILRELDGTTPGAQ
jgi:hypothetical protein